jgi:hypothetical protein
LWWFVLKIKRSDTHKARAFHLACVFSWDRPENLTWQSPAQVKQQDLYISPARNQFYIVIKPDPGLIRLRDQIPSYIQGYIVIKERFLARRKNIFEKKIGLYRVDPASQPRLIVFCSCWSFTLPEPVQPPGRFGFNNYTWFMIISRTLTVYKNSQ